MKEPPFLSVVIPAYEAERVIRSTIDAVQRHARARRWPIEIVIGFSRGADRTAEELEAACAAYDNVSVVDTTARSGKGGAVQGAMAATSGRVRCFIDADNGVSFDQIDRALELLRDCHIVMGSRYVPGGSAGRRPLARVVLSRGGNFLMKLLLGLDYADTRAPLKVYRSEIADRLFPASRLAGFGFDTELLFLASKLGLRVAEIPVRWESGRDSKVRVGRDALRSILELLQIRWYWSTGRYRVAWRDDSAASIGRAGEQMPRV